jgi:hypothetical protein
MFDTPNGLVMVNFFSKLSGYHAVSEYSRLDHSEMVLGPFENLTNLVLDPLIQLLKVRNEQKSLGFTVGHDRTMCVKYSTVGILCRNI